MIATLNGIGREMPRPDGKQCYIAADGRRFLMRFCNGEFGSKWAGFWNVPVKVLDFFSYRLVIDGTEEALSGGNCDSFTLEGTNRALHKYIPSVSIGAEEISSVINEGLVSALTIENKEKQPRKVTIELECGFNFRRASEDYHVREYETSADDLGISVMNDVGHCHISATEKLRLIKQFYKDHFPGAGLAGWKFFNESNQRCLVAVLGMDVELKPLEKKTVRVLFGVHHKKPENSLALQIDGTIRKVPYGFYIVDKKYQRFLENITCQMGTFEAITDNGFGYFSGHPNKVTFSCRDECLAIPAYLNAGMPVEAKSALLAIQKHQNTKTGLMPSEIRTDGTVEYGVVDATPLWVIAIAEYFDFVNDSQFFEILENPIKRALNAFDKLDSDGDFLAEAAAPNEKTWMETTERTGKPIELEAFWMTAFGRAADLFEAYGRPEATTLRAKHDKIRNSILGAFGNGEYFWDRVTYSGEKTGRSINPIFMTYFKELDDLQGPLTLINIEREFSSPNGIRSWSPSDAGPFNPESPYRGMAWNFLTSAMIVSEMNYGRTGPAVKYLDILLDNFGRRCINSLDEVYDSEGTPQGTVNHALSVCLIPPVFDRHFFGLRPQASRNRITIEPKMPADMAFFERKNFMFNGRALNFGFVREGSEIELFVKGMDPSTEVVFIPPKGTSEIDVNDRKVPIMEKAVLKSFTALKISYKAV